jgi:hypothetical protein
VIDLKRYLKMMSLKVMNELLWGKEFEDVIEMD